MLHHFLLSPAEDADGTGGGPTTVIGAQMESTSCPLCGGERRHVVLAAGDRLDQSARMEYTVVRCDECGLAFTDPRPTPEAIVAFYPESYGGMDHDGWQARLEQAYRDRQQHEVLAWLAMLRPGRGRLLDAGCGSGDLLEALRTDGWDVLGVEPSAAAAELARRRHGLDVVTGRFETADLPPASFDVVTMTSVLEHLHDPRTALRRARELLRPGGLVAVLFVPRFDSSEAARFGPRWLALDLPRHLTHFTDETLQTLADAVGLRVAHREDYSRRHNAAQLVGSRFPSLQKHRFYQREATGGADMGGRGGGERHGDGWTPGNEGRRGGGAPRASGAARRLPGRRHRRPPALPSPGPARRKRRHLLFPGAGRAGAGRLLMIAASG